MIKNMLTDYFDRLIERRTCIESETDYLRSIGGENTIRCLMLDIAFELIGIKIEIVKAIRNVWK